MALPTNPKDALLRYLNVAHDAVTWKLEGVDDYDVRRPLTPTGTNLLGLVKHLAWVELGYFGDVFDQPHGLDVAEYDEDNPNADMYARADESRAEIMSLFDSARAHATKTIETLDLDTPGHVPWWGENNPVSLGLIIVHMTTEMYRHLGQIDILREGIDGSAGLREESTNLPPIDAKQWQTYYQSLEEIALTHRNDN